MMLYHTPDLLLLDEHTSALDPRAEKELMELTYRVIREREITTIMCTHKPEHATMINGRLIGLKNGKVSLDKQHTAGESINGFLKKIYGS